MSPFTRPERDALLERYRRATSLYNQGMDEHTAALNQPGEIGIDESSSVYVDTPADLGYFDFQVRPRVGVIAMYRGHKIGSVIRALRKRRLAGADIPALIEYLTSVLPGHRNGRIDYLNAAFCQGVRLTTMLFSFDGNPDPHLVAHSELWIDEKRSEWEHQPFPELRTTRDYFSLLQLAVEERLVIFVCGVRSGDDGYRLHGVYTEQGEPAWTAKRGEHLRATLNRRLGGELIRTGPHDEWEYRNSPEIAGPLYGPQLPVIEFSHEQTIVCHLSVKSLAQQPVYRHHWARLYPHHPVTK
jgi:hypothetical protein